LQIDLEPFSRPAILPTPPLIDADGWDLARRIHRSILPGPLRDERADIAVHYEEHEILGGDYCTMLKRTDDHLFLCVCDVTGHGLPAALVASRISGIVRDEIIVARHPCEVVDTLNRFVAGEFARFGIYATFLCVEIDLHWRSIAFAGAGHPPALLQRRNRTIEPLASQSPLIGVFPEMGRQCQVSKTFFEPGDRLLLFTDGLTETHNVEGDMFGIDGVTAILRGLDDVADSEAVLAALTAARRRFARDEVPEDDVLLLAARFL